MKASTALKVVKQKVTGTARAKQQENFRRLLKVFVRLSNCGKHFRSTTGNTIHHLHLKPKIEAYISCMNQGMSLRKTADKLEISLNTAFRWRHRFLSAMKKDASNKDAKAQTVSAYVLPFSNKGKLNSKPKRPKVTSIFKVNITGNVSVQVMGQFGVQPYTLESSNRYTYIPAKSIPTQFKSSAHKCRNEKLKTLTKKMHD